MNFNLKTYKRLKLRQYFKKVNLFFFFHGACLNSMNWAKIEQTLSEEELQYLRILNPLLIATINDSIFKSLATMINGPMLLLHRGNTRLIVEKLNSVNLRMSLLCLKLNNKLYSKKQIKGLKTLSYNENVFLFHNSMKFVIKMPYHKFRSRKIIEVSK